MKLFKRDHYEKLFATRAKTVQDYHLQIAHAQEKIKELQAQCQHTSWEVAFYSWRPGAHQPSRICTSCRFRISDATETESKRLWAAFYNGEPVMDE